MYMQGAAKEMGLCGAISSKMGKRMSLMADYLFHELLRKHANSLKSPEQFWFIGLLEFQMVYRLLQFEVQWLLREGKKKLLHV